MNYFIVNENKSIKNIFMFYVYFRIIIKFIKYYRTIFPLTLTIYK